MVANTSFAKFKFSLEIYHWLQTLSVMFLEVTDSLCTFPRNYLPNAQSKQPVCLSVIPSPENGVLWKRSCQFNAQCQPVHRCFALRHFCFGTEGVPCTCLISSNRMLRRHVLRVEILCFMQDTLWWLFSCSVVSDSLWPHGLQHTRLPCPSLSPGVCSNSCPLSQWCRPTISSSVAPHFSSWLQSFPASGSFPMSGPWMDLRTPCLVFFSIYFLAALDLCCGTRT